MTMEERSKMNPEETRRVEQSRSKPHIVEALIFGSDEPLTLKQIVSIISSAEDTNLRMKITEDEVLQYVRELNAQYVQTGRAFRIIHVAGGYQFATMPEYADWLGKMVREKAKRKLSHSALETLAVIAYKQPVTKPEIEAIRGVGADYVVSTLLERGLITIVGRAATPGRPLLYGTTQDFLKHFGINDLADLPKPREIDEIMKEPGFELEKELLRRMGKSEDEIEEIEGKTVVGEDGVIRKIEPDDDDSDETQEDRVL
jgi:segregation and condensation protein B